MLSRVADSIYWMTRYIERAENVARFIDVNLHLMLDLPGESEQQWEPLINTTGDRRIFEEHFQAYTREDVIRFLTFDPDYANSILGCVHRARDNAMHPRGGPHERAELRHRCPTPCTITGSPGIAWRAWRDRIVPGQASRTGRCGERREESQEQVQETARSLSELHPRELQRQPRMHRSPRSMLRVAGQM